MSSLDSKFIKELYENIQRDEKTFNNLDLRKEVRKRYLSALEKAEKAYQKEVTDRLLEIREYSLNEKDLQNEINKYAREITRLNKYDNCEYRKAFKEIIKETDKTNDEQDEMIIDKLCNYINSIPSDSKKLHFIENLENHIYNSRKISLQFLLFKNNQTVYFTGKKVYGFTPKETQIEKDYLITKHSRTWFKYSNSYIISEKEKRKVQRQVENPNKYFLDKTIDNKGNYKITYKPAIDNKINSALKRDYNVFNESNKNYRLLEFSNIGNFEVFKINNKEYLIESSIDNKKISISIYNYEYFKKWLAFLNGLIGNYDFGQLEGVKESIIEDALHKKINEIEGFANDIENIFYHCLDFHNDRRFECINSNLDRFSVLTYLPNKIFFWKQTKDNKVNNSIGNLLMRLEDLFISANLSDFMQIKDFVNLWIRKTIDITINNKERMFQWAYSPFRDNVFNLENKINKLFSDDRITLKNQLKKGNKQTSTNKNPVIQIQNALYTYYLQKGKYINHFEHPRSKGKIKEIEKIVKENNYGSSKTFQEKYNLISKKDIRIAPNQEKNIIVVIDMLEDYPKSKSIAIAELEEIKKIYT